MMKTLKASKTFEVRFSEVDSMRIVWHGSYPLYFEDAREAFGKKYGLEYMTMLHNNFTAPLVDLSFHYHKPLLYGMTPRIDIVYHPTEAAKLKFSYEIHDGVTDELLATGESTQVFLNAETNELMWENPSYIEEWKKKWLDD